MIYNKDIKTKDGTKIWISCYTPEIWNDKVIVIAPGVGLMQDFYQPFSEFLREHGFTVITFDYRGSGKSAPEKLSGYEATMHQWAVQDINAVLLYTNQHFSGKEIIYIGHCIGGEIVGLAPASQFINKLVLVSTALSCAKLWPTRDKIKIRMLKATMKILNKTFGYFPGDLIGIFSDLPKGVVYEWANWCDNPNGLFDTFPDNNYRKLSVPLLAYTFSDDWHCPPRAVKGLLSHFDNATITWYHIKPKEIGMKKVGHTDFFSISMKFTLWENFLLWIEKYERGIIDEKPLTIKTNLL